jgi:hypothetical protein
MRSPILNDRLNISERLQNKFDAASLPARAKITQDIHAQVNRVFILNPRISTVVSIANIHIIIRVMLCISGTIFLPSESFLNSFGIAFIKTISIILEMM